MAKTMTSQFRDATSSTILPGWCKRSSASSIASFAMKRVGNDVRRERAPAACSAQVQVRRATVMAGLLRRRLWRDTASCAEFGVASHPSYDGASLRSAAATACRLQPTLQLTPDGRLDVVVRDADACVDGSRAVLVTIHTPPHSLDRPFGPEDAGVLFRWHCDRKIVRPANGAHVLSRSGETITCAPRGSARLRLHANRAEFLDDNCAVASAALALDRRPLSVFVAASGTSARAVWRALDPHAVRCRRLWRRGARRGDQHPALRRAGVDGCACRCNAGFAGETCDVTDAAAAARCARRRARRRPRAASGAARRCGGVAALQAAVGRLGSTRAAVFVVRRRATRGCRRMATSPCGRPPAAAPPSTSSPADADTVASRSAAVSSLTGDCGGGAGDRGAAAGGADARPCPSAHRRSP